jgi:hypothetical protein
VKRLPKPSREDDLIELARIAPLIAAAQAEASELIEQRRAIFARRVNAGDCTKVELAEAAGTTRLNVTAALQPHLVKTTPAKRAAQAAKTKSRARAAARRATPKV